MDIIHSTWLIKFVLTHNPLTFFFFTILNDILLSFIREGYVLSKFLSKPNQNSFLSLVSRIPLVPWQPGITALTVVSDVLSITARLYEHSNQALSLPECSPDLKTGQHMVYLESP